MPPDSTETKRRILIAAQREFADFGLAGARIDRIAESARANKRSIYMHFGPKETLFDMIVSGVLAAMAEAVQFTPDDLTGYATRLFDYLQAEPDALRLTAWANLERPTATADEADTYSRKVDALSLRFGDHATDVLALILGLVTAWASASPALLSTSKVKSDEIRRTMLAHAAASLESTFAAPR
ncbi:TetR family transcriptional regulator [Gordonia sp. HY442]|uniref:TetR family transcriptional regulator n=1 Tax=Gordonia zhenghanii TaxID=2911516 RepID=UPI001F01ACCF|nr:TetR family transcriptional regulator [Gordonia zhenghanii]MCF8604276.1 TetR family transcriptional regulator [Gordonia zhenghanii]